MISNTADSGITMMIDLTSVWKNETTVDGLMVAQPLMREVTEQSE